MFLVNLTNMILDQVCQSDVHVQMKELCATGEVNAKTRCWAQGLDTWKATQNIPQLKWSLFAKGSPVLNETELASTILTMFIKMCQFYPSKSVPTHICACFTKV